MTDSVTILGVEISKITKEKAVKTVDSWLRHSGQARMTQYIVTPNPEMLVLAQKDQEFQNILNSADMAIPDGAGLVWASKILNKLKTKTQNFKTTNVIPAQAGIYKNNEVLEERVSGTDLMLALCGLAAQKGYAIGLLGAGGGVAQKVSEALKKKFPGIKIKFAVSDFSQLSTDSSVIPDLIGNPYNNYHMDSRLRGNDKEGKVARNDEIFVDLLFVAFGAPKQEKWIFNQVSGFRYQVSGKQKRSELTPKTYHLKANVYMGVGGAFDLISGKIKRAPKFMQNFGLEWFWRLIQEPARIKRIFTATIVFPWLVLVQSRKTNKKK